VPSGIDADGGVTAIETSTAGVTWTLVVPVTPELAAVIIIVPTWMAVARPAAFTVATVLSAELHVAVLVMSFVLLSEYVAVAASCCVVPLANDSGEGMTEIEVITAGLTVRVVLPLNPVELAVIVVVPTAIV
jgi:hypothetical protein